MLFPRQSDHDSQVGALRRIQEPTRRDIVGPDGVDSCRNHGFEVLGYPCRVRIFGAVLAGAKRAIRNTPDIKLFFPNEEEFSPHLGTRQSPKTGSGPAL